MELKRKMFTFVVQPVCNVGLRVYKVGLKGI
jgi:hypothetical protein